LISGWKLSQAYDKYDQEDKRLQNEKQVSWWWNWNELALAFQVAYKSDEILKSMENDSRKWWDLMNFYGVVQDFKVAIGESNEKRPVHFNIDDYKYHLLRINEFFLDNLQLLLTGKVSDKESIKEISTPLSINRDFNSRFSYSEEGILFDQKLIFGFPNYQRASDNVDQKPIKRREIIKTLFEDREEWVGSQQVKEGAPRSYSDLARLTGSADIHREMARVIDDFKKTANSALLEIKGPYTAIKKSRHKYFLLITRSNSA
jgi:hypothetical protein